MSVQPARGYLGISEVLAQLRADFPDISVSKIRFLEAEGLISPARSPAGYRRFCAADVDRLRFILAAQRDQYLPLRVIKERLAKLAQPAAPPPAGPGAADRPDGRGHGGPGERAGGLTAQVARPAAGLTAQVARPAAGLPADGADGPAGKQLGRRDLVAAAGITEALLTELETFGLLRRAGRYYPADALQVASSAAALSAYGVEARHLRAVRAAAERETAMIESLVAPILRQRGAGARALAARTAGELTGLVLQLHSALVAGAMAEAGLAQPDLADGSLTRQAQAAEGSAGAGQTRHDSRGIEGASA
jgi:DNA-binding transcriptional MerR regulator